MNYDSQQQFETFSNNVLIFPPTRNQKIERVAKAMADAENDNGNWADFIDMATFALQTIKEIK